MGIIIRQSIKSSIGYYLGVILGAINTLFIATHFLTADELAVSRILLENSLIMAAFMHLGAPHICDKFFAKFNNSNKQHNGILVYLLLFPIFGLMVFGFLFTLFLPEIKGVYFSKSPSIVQYIWLSLPMAFLWSIVMILEAYTRSNNRIAIPTFLRESLYRIINILLIVSYGLGFISFYAFLILNVFIILILIFSLLVYLKILGKLYIDIAFLKIDKEMIFETIKFGALVIVGGLGVNLILFLDRNIIAQKIGTEAVAVFIVASYIATTIEIPAKAIKQISGPILSGFIHSNELDKVSNLYKKSSLNLMLIGGLMLVLISVNVNEILGLLPNSSVYAQGKWIVLIISFSKWIEMSLGLNNEIITYSKYYKFNTFIILLMTLCVVVLNYLLIPIYGLLGSAIATGMVTFVSSIFRLIYVNQKFGLKPLELQNIPIVLCMIILISIGVNFPNIGESKMALFLSIAYKSIALSTIFLFVLIRFRISEDLNMLFNKYFSFLKLR